MDFKIYDFDINVFREFNSLKGKADLDSNGKNLTIVLRKILEDDDKKRLFYNILSDIIPYIKNLDVEKFYEKSLLLKFEEVYKSNSYIPSFLMSEGTISAIFIVLALFFDKNEFAIFEEPEKSFHPALISKLMQLYYDAETNKQIIITTHSPEVVKYTQLNDLFLVSRSNTGFTEISKPVNNEMVQSFLENDLGIAELYIQNLLGY
jgi:predicted ATPase